MKQAFEGNSQGRSKNAAYQKILKKLDKAIQLDRQLASNLDAVDDLVSLISEIKELCSDAKSTHWSKQTARNEAIEVLKLALDVKDRELLGLRYENLEKDYGNKTGRIVFRGDGRGPDHFGFDELGADETVFDMWDPDGEQSITQVGATQNMISTSSEHNLPSRYVGFAKQNHNKKTGGRFNFTIYAIYLPANSAILVSEYLEHRKERHEQGEAVGDMTGQGQYRQQGTRLQGADQEGKHSGLSGSRRQLWRQGATGLRRDQSRQCACCRSRSRRVGAV